VQAQELGYVEDFYEVIASEDQAKRRIIEVRRKT
jgi:hypothetical protein